ncbi:hypothetical protein AK812_SmicGene38951 [Symbiodinium microadriaticum]|uniref:Uncharacterized protein n=1 Tax=Symbiodinium microadriaticum TaxID=2951 RepID=A0A1Q9CCG1_SYMMI|nr:hypothetical protein AK812_SmicGene38951 [Symbiodinium microadriaticum]
MLPSRPKGDCPGADREGSSQLEAFCSRGVMSGVTQPWGCYPWGRDVSMIAFLMIFAIMVMIVMKKKIMLMMMVVAAAVALVVLVVVVTLTTTMIIIRRIR